MTKWNAKEIKKDADGRTIHEPNSTCPSCGSFNISGRCNCTQKEEKTDKPMQMAEVWF